MRASGIILSLAVLCAASGVFANPGPSRISSPMLSVEKDSVIYPVAAYKLNRKGDLGEIQIADSLLATSSFNLFDEQDTIPKLSARDTIFPPDSLRDIDPFRYKYYVALVDSLTHVQVRDSLWKSAEAFLSRGDTLAFLSDSLDWRRLDSTYLADSSALAKARFDAWFATLSKKEQRIFLKEQMVPILIARADSIKAVKEEKKFLKDSTIKATPRILETFAIPDSLQYKRLIQWEVDKDFHNVKPFVPDTSFNKYYYEYKFQREDVNSTWLGDAGTPTQYYNYFKRNPELGVDFYAPLESWTYTTRDFPQFNTKTAYTELAYWGSLIANKNKVSDNVHVLTTQNITPAFNFTILFDRWGTGGWIQNEKTDNRTIGFSTNYLGRKYLMQAGVIHHNTSRGESGGLREPWMIKDTTVQDTRELDVALREAASSVNRNTFYLTQQLRIPFNFINDIKARRDSTFSVSADSLDRNITTAFIGHTTEYNCVSRWYYDKYLEDDAPDFYKYSYYGRDEIDKMGVDKLDNRVFIRLQPWAESAVVSKLNVGIGDEVRWYTDTTRTGSYVSQNNIYAYAGIDGQIGKHIGWDAKAHLTFAGFDAGSFDVSANAALTLYPFRSDRQSPLSLRAHFETSLKQPTYHQLHLNTNHFKWDNDFGKVSTTKLEGFLDIPHWRLNLQVGYGLLGNALYYGTDGAIHQSATPLSILSASLRKEFVIGNVLHLDNKILVQKSTNESVVPLPTAAFNLRYFVEFPIAKSEDKSRNILVMQFGANIFYNTAWYAPAWNPALGVFHNQTDEKYTNGPTFDLFFNFQWKKACLFVKMINVGRGWPATTKDYFSAHGYVLPQVGIDALRFGIYWPFYLSPVRNKEVSH